MLLSIGVITYERPEYLNELLTSISNSAVLNDKDAELIILDNGSGLKTSELLKEWAKKLTFKLIQNDCNVRGTAAYKKIIEAAKGEWIVTPGDDDFYQLKGLDIIIRECKQADGEVSLIPFGAKTIDEKGRPTPITFKPRLFHNKNEFLANIIFESPFWMPATAIRRKFVDTSQIPRSITVVDWWLWLNGGLKGKIKTAPTPVISYRIHTGQEQKSYLEDSWQLDRASVFINEIHKGTISHYVKGLSDWESDNLVSCITDQVKARKVNQTEKVLLIQLCQEIERVNGALSTKLKELLIVAGVDLRFAASFTDSNLSNNDYVKAIQIFRNGMTISSDNSFIDDIFDKSISELEKVLSRILMDYRAQELKNSVTPFEKRLLSLFRRIRTNSAIRWIIRK